MRSERPTAAPGGVITPSSGPAPSLDQELGRLRREKGQWAMDRRVLELKIDKLQRQLWEKKSERMPRDDGKQKLLSAEPAQESGREQENSRNCAIEARLASV